MGDADSLSIKRFSVGLTGGIGSGKTTIADMFAARGATVIDTDQIAHQLTAPNGLAIPAIRTQFGDQFLTAQGAMERAKMRDYVFADATAKARLESILHPLIRSETERAVMHASGPYVMLVIPLLVESGTWKQHLSRVLVVDCAEDLQKQRVMLRSQLTKSQVEAIMASQASRAIRLAAADDIIVNDGDMPKLEPQVERLHTLYCSLASTAGDG
jgi:dephospho-CoA kinase